VEEQQVGGWAARVHAWRNDRRVAAALCAGIALVAAFAWWRTGPASGAPAPAPVPAASSPSSSSFVPSGASSTTVAGVVVVDVVGAVRAPGVVHVRNGSRVVDAIAAAGGAAPDADVARLNLAAPVADGSRIAVPKVGQPAVAVDPGAVTGAPGGASAGSAPAGPVDINTATAAELDALPGVGPATAAAIVTDREQHGPFASVDDLSRVRGIGPAKLAQLHDLVTV